MPAQPSAGSSAQPSQPDPAQPGQADPVQPGWADPAHPGQQIRPSRDKELGFGPGLTNVGPDWLFLPFLYFFAYLFVYFFHPAALINLQLWVPGVTSPTLVPEAMWDS